MNKSIIFAIVLVLGMTGIFYSYREMAPSLAKYETKLKPLLVTPEWKVFFRSFQESPVHDVQIMDGKVNIALTSRGSGQTHEGIGANHLMARYRSRGKELTHLETRLQVKSVTISACKNNPVSALLRTTLGGFFFNTLSKKPKNIRGDVFSVIGLAKSSTDGLPADTLTLKGVVLLCEVPCYLRAEDAPRGAKPSKVLYEKDFGTVKVGESVFVGLDWHPSEKKFVFMKDRQALGEFTVDRPRVGDTTVRGPHIDVAHFVPNCESEEVVEEMTTEFSDTVMQ